MKRSVIRLFTMIAMVLILSLGFFTGCSTKSAYELAVENGFSGSQSEWLESLKGKSAYEAAVENGFIGTEAEWLVSLKSDDVTIEALYEFYKESHPDCTLDEFVLLFAGASRDPIQDAAQQAMRSAVSVQARFSGVPSGESDGSGGSGVIFQINMETGVSYIITNYHVIYRSSAQTKVSTNIQVAPYGREYFPQTGSDLILSVKANFVGGSITKDIAILKTVENTVLNSGIYMPVRVADSNRIAVGEPALAAGNPENSGLAVTSGIINVDSEFIPMKKLANANETELHRVIRVDTAINKGNSGGGLFNKDGELIGIVNAKAIDAEIDNIGYAIPSNVAIGIAQNVIDDIRHNNSYIKYRIGLETEISGSWAVLDEGMVRIQEEIKVKSVTIGLPAATAAPAKRVKTGDIIQSAQLFDQNGNERAPKIEITRNFILSDYLFLARENDVLTITVLRDGQEVGCEAVISADYYTLLEQL